MNSDEKPKHRYKKDKNGFQIETTDPVQDVMSDEELDEANDRILDLLDDNPQD